MDIHAGRRMAMLERVFVERVFVERTFDRSEEEESKESGGVTHPPTPPPGGTMNRRTSGEALRLRHMANAIEGQPGVDLTNAWTLLELHGTTKPNTLLHSVPALEQKAITALRQIATSIEWEIAARECAA